MSADNIRVLAMVEAASINGATKAVLEFAREAAQGHVGSPKIELSILTFRRSQQEDVLTSAIRRAGISLDIVIERGRFDVRVIPQLRAIMKMRRPNVLWSNSVKSHFLIRAAGLHHSATWVAFHHGYTSTDVKMLAYNQLDRWSLMAADHVLTVCNPFARELQQRGIPRDRISVRHMPIRPFVAASPERIEPLRKEMGITNHTQVVLSVGRLSSEKGHADLIRAFRILREGKPSSPVQLIIVGGGPEQPKLKALCDQLDLHQHVRLVGHQDDVAPYYSLATVFALPSHSEGSPNVLLEAMAAGVPPVAMSVGGIPEIATDQIDALLISKGDVGGLAQAMLRMLEDESLRQRLVRAGRQIVARHTPEAFYRSIASTFQETLSFGNVPKGAPPIKRFHRKGEESSHPFRNTFSRY